MNNNGLRKITKAVGKNSPTILTGLGVIGLFGTAAMAVQATPKALYLIQDTEEEERRILEPKEIFQLTWKCYLPALGMAVLSSACIIGANKINLKRNAAAVSMYSISQAALREYQKKVVEQVGVKKHINSQDEVYKEKMKDDPASKKEVIITDKGETLCYDAMSGRYFKSDIEHIRQVMNKCSRDLMSEMTMSLNDVYYELGLDGVKIGDFFGWHIDDGLIEPRFSSQLTDEGKPCLVLDFETDLRHLYTD